MSSTIVASTATLSRPLPQRAGQILMRDLIDLYMQEYNGKDPSRVQRLGLWSARIGANALQDVSDDDVHTVLEELALQSSRYFAGKDADGKPIYKAKKKPIAPATINRYSASLAAVFTWAIRKRIAPRGFVHPCRGVERRAENNVSGHLTASLQTAVQMGYRRVSVGR